MAERGNYVSEWFGHRVYPVVDRSPTSLSTQQANRCPFLTAATGESKDCVKSAAAHGICTINSASNGPRQDWLICPYRALDQSLLDQVARRLYGISETQNILVVPAPTMAREADRQRVTDAVRRGDIAIVYLQDKLGGEISISPTDRSPELSFDITLAQVVNYRGTFTVGQYGIFEVQTMDFHGSYRAVVQNLKDALRLHGERFHDEINAHHEWLSQKIEGPNIANVFKRTFYQMVLKFQIGADEACAGCVLALPEAVWDSWQRHLGKPELARQEDGTYALRYGPAVGRIPAWIYVFDLDTAAAAGPASVRVTKVIATDADSIVHFALRVAPEAAITVAGGVTASIRRRVAQWWPELASVPETT